MFLGDGTGSFAPQVVYPTSSRANRAITWRTSTASTALISSSRTKRTSAFCSTAATARSSVADDSPASRNGEAPSDRRRRSQQRRQARRRGNHGGLGRIGPGDRGRARQRRRHLPGGHDVPLTTLRLLSRDRRLRRRRRDRFRALERRANRVAQSGRRKSRSRYHGVLGRIRVDGWRRGCRLRWRWPARPARQRRSAPASSRQRRRHVCGSDQPRAGREFRMLRPTSMATASSMSSRTVVPVAA